jgi:nucleoside-diphosphate-sugar epimerase
MVAFITGITGQDGYYLARHLHQLGAEVWGTSRAAILPQELNFARLVPIADYTDQKRSRTERSPNGPSLRCILERDLWRSGPRAAG